MDKSTEVIFYQPAEIDWNLGEVVNKVKPPATLMTDIDAIITTLVEKSRPGDHVLIMSNGGFGGIHQKLLSALKSHYSPTT